MIDLKLSLWSEEWRPEKINDCVLPSRISTPLHKYVANKNGLHLMFTGIQGSGKTTCALALVKELEAEYLFIDASTENGKQMIQDSVIPFASTVSIVNPLVPKFIILDESDALTFQAQQSLRPTIEKFGATTRFIFTGNYPAKFIPAIKSRCDCFDFNIRQKDKPELMVAFLKRACSILDSKSVTYDKKVLSMLIMKLFPDYRKILVTLQSFGTSYGHIDEGILTLSEDSIAETLYPLILKRKFDEARKYIQESVHAPEDIYAALYKGMKDLVPAKMQPSFIVILADYQFKSMTVANQQLNTLACLVELMGAANE